MGQGKRNEGQTNQEEGVRHNDWTMDKYKGRNWKWGKWRKKVCYYGRKWNVNKEEWIQVKKGERNYEEKKDENELKKKRQSFANWKLKEYEK